MCIRDSDCVVARRDGRAAPSRCATTQSHDAARPSRRDVMHFVTLRPWPLIFSPNINLWATIPVPSLTILVSAVLVFIVRTDRQSNHRSGWQPLTQSTVRFSNDHDDGFLFNRRLTFPELLKTRPNSSKELQTINPLVKAAAGRGASCCQTSDDISRHNR